VFLGHGFLAFALVAGAAHLAGWDRDRALVAGLLAGGFGLAPDVDMLYAPLGVLGAEGPLDAATEFWRTGNVVHRAVTHSLPVGVVATTAAGAWATRTRPGRGIAVLLAGVLVAVAFVVSGSLGAAVMAPFCVAVLGLAAVGSLRLSPGSGAGSNPLGRLGASASAAARTSAVGTLRLSPWTVTAAAAVGQLSHPFGDVLTGEPPAFLYPFDPTLLATRPRPFPDPTLNLLLPLFLELATAWLALEVFCSLDDRPLFDRLTGLSGLGVAYAGAVFVLPGPTLDVSYHFVFPLVGLGLLAAAPALRGWQPRRDDPATRRRYLLAAATNGLAAVTVAAVAYAAAYLAVGGA
jgi:membrane-bound metal-dependent hydrolase YbcI (DUF457 family)